MQFSKSSEPSRKVVAAICDKGSGLLVPRNNSVWKFYVDQAGTHSFGQTGLCSLDNLTPEFTPIYEGDEITIKF